MNVLQYSSQVAFSQLLTQRCRLLARYGSNLHPFGRFCGIGDYTRLSPPSRTASEMCKVTTSKVYIDLGKLPLNSSNNLFQFSVTSVSTPISAVLYFSVPSLKHLYYNGTIRINKDCFIHLLNLMSNEQHLNLLQFCHWPIKFSLSPI